MQRSSAAYGRRRWPGLERIRETFDSALDSGRAQAEQAWESRPVRKAAKFVKSHAPSVPDRGELDRLLSQISRLWNYGETSGRRE